MSCFSQANSIYSSFIGIGMNVNLVDVYHMNADFVTFMSVNLLSFDLMNVNLRSVNLVSVNFFHVNIVIVDPNIVSPFLALYDDEPDHLTREKSG